MRLNRTELRKIIYDYSSLCNRLLQADFRDYNDVLSRFIRYVTNTEIIYDYITDCGDCEQDIAQAYREVESGDAIFALGDTDEEEVRNVYAILKHAVDADIDLSYRIGMAYSSSRSYQEILKSFNERVTMVLIRHIETYLTKVGIDMGVDDKVVYNISVKDGQVNIANDNAVINASNNVGAMDSEKLNLLIEEVRDEIKKCTLSEEDAESVESSLSVIKEECATDKPRKAFIKTAITGIKAIKGTAEFTAAVIALYQFIQPFIM